MAQGRSFAARRADSPKRRSDARPHYRDERRRKKPSRPKTEREPRVPDLDLALDAPAFAELGLPRPLTTVLANLEILEPFPIQAATIPDALAGHDVLGRGRTGSGKTLAFGLPMLTRLMGSKSKPKYPRAMVLVPTRELAMQVRDALTPLAQQAKLSIQLVIGGASYQRQIEGFQRAADIVVATPGRLIDLVNQRAVDLSEVEIAVLDEADQMADMGFLDEVEELMQYIPAGGQRLLFSATLDRGIDGLVKRHLRNPIEHATDPETASVSTMVHHLFVVDAREKPAIVYNIAKRAGRTICFARTQLGVEQWAQEFEDMGIAVEALHGGKSQAARGKAINNFKAGRVNVLVATDVAARGIHVDDVDLVLQIDPPRDPKDYLHRAGRTARAGATGQVVLIATTRQVRSAENMLRQAGVEATDKRVRAGDDYIAEITGARDDVPAVKRKPHLKEEQRVRRAVVEHDDGLSFADRREARPRTSKVDDHRFRPREDRPRRDNRFDDRPRRTSRDDDRRPRRDERGDDRPRRTSRYDDAPRRSSRDDQASRRTSRYDDAPRRMSRYDDAPRRTSRYDDAPRRESRSDDRPRRTARVNDRVDDRPRRTARADERPRRTARVDDYSTRQDQRPGRKHADDAPRPKKSANRKKTDKPRWSAAKKKAAKKRK